MKVGARGGSRQQRCTAAAARPPPHPVHHTPVNQAAHAHPPTCSLRTSMRASCAVSRPMRPASSTAAATTKPLPAPMGEVGNGPAPPTSNGPSCNHGSSACGCGCATKACASTCKVEAQRFTAGEGRASCAGENTQHAFTSQPEPPTSAAGWRQADSSVCDSKLACSASSPLPAAADAALPPPPPPPRRRLGRPAERPAGLLLSFDGLAGRPAGDRGAAGARAGRSPAMPCIADLLCGNMHKTGHAILPEVWIARETFLPGHPRWQTLSSGFQRPEEHTAARFKVQVVCHLHRPSQRRGCFDQLSFGQTPPRSAIHAAPTVPHLWGKPLGARPLGPAAAAAVRGPAPAAPVFRAAPGAWCSSQAGPQGDGKGRAAPC